MDDRSRRQFLVAGGASVASVLSAAGCLSRSSGTGGPNESTSTDPGTTTGATADPETTARSTTQRTTGDPPATGAAGTDEVRWTFKTGDAVQATPRYRDGTVFVGSTDGRVYALDAATGEEVWRYDAGEPVDAGMGGEALVLDGDTLYVAAGESGGLHGRDYAVHAVDAASGEREWKNAPEDAGLKWFSLLGVADGAVHVGTSNDALGDSGDPTFALDAASGDALWTAETGDASAASLGDGTAFVAAQSTLYALGDDGEEEWTYDTPGYGILPPAFDGRNVYSGTSEHEQSYAAALDPASGEERWRVDGWTVTSLRLADALYVGGERVVSLTPRGEERWSYERGGLVARAPVADGTLYGLSGHGAFALDTSDGSERWAVTPPREYASPYAVAEGTVVLRANTGTLFGLDAATGERQWTFSVATEKGGTLPETGSGAVFVGAPDGTVYARAL